MRRALHAVGALRPHGEEAIANGDHVRHIGSGAEDRDVQRDNGPRWADRRSDGGPRCCGDRDKRFGGVDHGGSRRREGGCGSGRLRLLPTGDQEKGDPDGSGHNDCGEPGDERGSQPSAATRRVRPQLVYSFFSRRSHDRPPMGHLGAHEIEFIQRELLECGSRISCSQPLENLRRVDHHRPPASMRGTARSAAWAFVRSSRPSRFAARWIR